MRRFSVFLAVLASLVFIVSCGDGSGSSSGKKQGELYGACYPNKTCNDGLTCDEENDVCLPDGADNDSDDDSDVNDPTDPNDSKDPTDLDDEDTYDTEEPDNTEKPDDNPEEPDNTEKPDENPEEPEDNDITEEPEDHDTPETPDEDNETPVNSEATENHKISGIFQVGTGVSGIEAALFECGSTEKIAFANTDAKGKFSFNTDITASKTYCVKAGDFASCFKGMSDHTANISEITNAAYLLDKTCADLRKSETKIRTYAKLGTGEWLGELDYSKLSGIKEGLKLFSNYLKTTNNKTISEKIAEDAKKETPAFGKFFNGFRISANKTEIVLDESTDNSTTFSAEGGSTKVAPGFKITWTMKNKTAEAATYKFTTSTPGEYVARAKLVSGSTTLSDGSASVLYLQKKKSGAIYLNGKSKNISHYIDNGIYVVIPKNTVVKKDGNVVTKITYDILSAGGNQVSRLKFYPEGAVFEGDSMYFVYELGTVYGGDPIMLSAKRTNTDGTVDVLNSAAGDPIMMAAAGDPIMTTAAGDPIMTAAAGDPIMTSAAGDPIMTSAAGDPIMNAAAGDPIMTSAAGDPIMAAAAGDPIMMGTSSSAMISQTNHYSIFTVEAANLPVSVDALLDRWCDGSFYRNYSPVAFIKAGFQKFKPESTLLPYLTCENRKFGDLGNDLYELINKQVGYQRNLNLIENIFFVSEFYNRMQVKKNNHEVAAVKNGLELRSAIAALYTATTAHNRSAALADLFDSSMIPITYSGVTPADYTAKAKSSITGNFGSGDIYTATKKEMMIFANYITTSSKGPDFDSVESVLTPDQLVCAWFDSNTEPQNCNKIYTLNDAGHVTLGGTELSAAEANAIFSEHFMPMNSRLSDEEKLDLFRTFYLALKYAGTIFYGGSDIDELNDALLKTAYLVFDGIDDNAKAVSIVDTFDASVHTVSVLDGNDMATRPYLTKLSALTDQISLKVAPASADIEKVLISIEGNEFDKVQENTRTYYKPKGSLKEKSIVLTPGTLSGLKPLKDLLGSEDVDSLGNITGKMTIVVNSKISGKTYSTQKTYEFFVNGESDGVNSKEVPANIQIRVNDSNGNAIPDNANPTIILNPGNRVFYSAGNLISIENLTPAAYTIDAFADGYYAKNVSVNVPSGATFDVEIRLDEETTGSADANLELSVKIDTAKHPSKVYIQIYNDDMDLVANETAKFNGEGRYETINIPMGSGRYTLLAVGEDMYNYLEAITLYEGNNSKEITVIAKNACGNGIVDSAEECEPSQSEPVLCGTIYPAAPNPNEHATCDPDTCTFNKTACGKAAFCGDGIIDSPAEHCDGGSKACAEIAGSGDSGSAPCATDCSRYITENNCRKTTESCGNLKENAVWNDGEGKFTQTHDGANWLPATKSASYGITKEECVFSCKKGYKWDGSDCIPSPLSLALICTGETDCFSDTDETECPAYGTVFFGQDAQYAQTGFCTPHKLTAAVNGIVKETYTHYEWQAVSSEEMNWDDANDYCSHLNDESGSSALWRIPSPSELLTIVNSGTASPALDDKFTARGHTFWASEDSRNSEKAWMLGENGEITSVDKADTNSVICVKHGFDTVQNRFSATAETVKDSDSGLMWQKQPVASVTWEKALSYCEEVSTADKFDWRLPNRNELASLINYEKENGVVSDFPGIAEKGFWTSTSSATAGNEAWTVDFASGKIEPAEKNDTKYVICVRNDEPCFGDECAEPCSFNACKGMANSTGLCTANDYSFTCGCKSGFNWNHGKCLLATTRYTACEGLPENAVWNTVFGISQSYDGEDWYPSNIGTFNKTPSSTECRFVCATNYTWDAENDTCQPKSTVTQCSEKKPNSEWNSVSRISQTWDGEKWVPSATSVYNTEPSEDECRFICKEHYNWNDENNTCDGETQPATCIGLPANAHWWNEDASITQTWTNGGWAPTATGTHSTDAENNRCFFTCNENYKWNDTSCVAKSQTVNCIATTDNSEWTGGFSSIKQTWNGSEWFPSNVGSYNTEANSSYCRFKCKANYNWNGSSCVAATQLATCTGLPENAQWNTVSSITQTWTKQAGSNSFEWSPSAVGTYGNATTTECHYICKENYNYNEDTGKCDAATQNVACIGLPANASWINSTVNQTWSGSQGWTPTSAGHHKSVSTSGCSFDCNTNYTWNSNTSTCDGAKQNGNCTGLPANAQWLGSNSIQQTWNGSDWRPELTGSYSETAVANECRFACKTHYIWDGTKCNAETNVANCGTLPGNAVWNTVSTIIQTWNGSKFMPEAALVFNETPATNECHFKCDTNYYWKNNTECAPQQKTNQSCTGLPANAQWWNNVSSITQTWDGENWSPTTAGVHATGGAANQCRFKCIDEGTKFDWVENACVGHTNPNVACDSNSLPANASWWNSSINQTWNGTEWLPTTTGSFANSAVDNQCRFYCNNHYNWNGTTCEAETRIRSCEDLPNTTAYEYNTASSITQHWDESVSGFVPSLTPEYSSEATTAYCRFKCKENYEWKNGSCRAAKKTGNCTGLPANAQWNTKLENGSSSDGQITQTWNGENWEPELYGGFGGQDAPAANSCIFKCEENYEWKDNLCAAKKRTVQCIVLPDELPEGLPEDAECDDIETCCRKYPSLCQPANAAWNEVPTVLQEWKGFAWSPSDVGIYSDEPSQSECFFKCKENYSWDEENEVCVPDTRIADCTDLPNGAVWNYAPYITQTWSGSEWLPSTKAKYSVSASEDECLYICDTGKYSYDGLCVTNACTTPDDYDYFPCDDVENSSEDYIGDCTSKDHLLLPYSCKCNSGYYWYGKTGCRNVKPKNICTDAVRCYSNDHEIGCPSEGEDFYGQDVQYADKGYCAQKDFTIEETGGVQITYDKNTGLRWQKARGGYMLWEAAKNYCEGLNASSYGGYSSGWRLPTIKELQTIVDYGKSSPSLDTNYFNQSGNPRWWSATEDASNSGKAWYLLDQGGTSTTYSKTASTLSIDVRCVRGTTLSETLSTSTTNGVRKDNNTKLYWQVDYTSKTWEEALEYCENLEYGGYSDWRLPNVNELYSLINHGRYGPASTFSGMPGATFWTSTANAASVLSVNFANGTVSTIVKNYSEYVRCVRSDLCNDGEYWDGKNCITSPCNENPCTMENSNGACTPLPYYSAWTYSCGCVEGYRWDARVRECVADPCFDNICESMEGSTGECYAYDGSSSNTRFQCLCVDGYFWDGSRCRPSGVPGSICTNNSLACFNNTTTITCPTSESADFYGQDGFGRGKCESNSTNLFTETNVADQPVVRVPITGQMWQKNVSTTKYTFNQAVTYCANLDYGGYTDWRLPKPKELLTIVGTNIGSFPQPVAGDGTFTYWTSKKSASDPNNAWIVIFRKIDVSNYLGSMYTLSSGEKNYVRCVRGEILPENSSFTEFTPEGTTNVVVKDNVTGLIWQKTESASMTWQAALKYCADSTYAGYTDWRLPTKDQLISILNFDRYSPATDFPGTFSASHWTSTTSMYDQYKRAYYSLINSSGAVHDVSKTTSNRVRCVR